MLSKINVLNQQFTIKLLLMLLTSISTIMLGVTNDINWQSKTLTINHQVFAQTPSDDELQKYAQAAKEIETLRQSTFSQIEAQVGKEKANQLACNQTATINQLPESARNIAQNYCTQSEAIVKKNGLTISQFNQITQQRKQNPSLNQKIQNMISP